MMEQNKTIWLRKIISLSIAILAAVSSVANIKPAFAQVTAANFDEVDSYISTKMKELGIPGAALVILPNTFGAKMAVILFFRVELQYKC
jgi:hypothetical protein